MIDLPVITEGALVTEIEIKIQLPSGMILTATLYNRADAEFLVKVLSVPAKARGLQLPRAYERALNEIKDFSP